MDDTDQDASYLNQECLFPGKTNITSQKLPEVDKMYISGGEGGRYNSICSRIKYIQLLKRAEN